MDLQMEQFEGLILFSLLLGGDKAWTEMGNRSRALEFEYKKT